LSPLLFYFALQYAIRKVKEDQEKLEFSEKYQPLVTGCYDVDILGENIKIP
jgi:hypothetical protein